MLVVSLVTLVCFVVCAISTQFVRRHVLAKQILDHPNERSSHTVATPRGGGLAIALVLFGATVGGAAFGLVDWPFAAAITLGGGAVAVVGWLDDLGKAKVSVRLLVQILAATGAVIALRGMPQVTFGTDPVAIGWIGSVLAIIGIVWCTNLYNFMDGIDGIAASEATMVAGAAAVFSFLSGHTAASIVLAALAGSAGGFLLWNWQPARIFMGDVGSGLIGFVLGTCLVATQRSQPAVPTTIWLVLFLAFVADATLTLLRRLYARLPLHLAHRSHAYQRAVQAGFSHRGVTGCVIGLNVLLTVIAVCMWKRPALTLSLTLLACTVVVLMYCVVERMKPMHDSRTPSESGLPNERIS